MNDWLTPNEVADLLMVSPVTVRQWAQKGLLEARTTPGGHRRFSIDAIRQFAIREGMSSRLEGKAGLSILVVDDDDRIRNLLKDIIFVVLFQVVNSMDLERELSQCFYELLHLLQ